MGSENTEKISLGKRLKQLTSAAKTNIEIGNFTAVLEGVANEGNSKVAFPDLREYLPTLIMDGTIWGWLQEQELVASGEVKGDTGAYAYTISWE